jgi:hypothetical protein
MLATAGIGFALKGNVDKLQTKVNSANGKIADAEGKAKAAQKDAETAKKDAKEQQDVAAAATQKAEAATKDAETANTKVKEKDIVIESKDKEIAELKNKPGTPAGVDPAKLTELQTKVDELTATNQKLSQERDEAKVAFDAQNAKAKENEVKVAELEKKEKDRANYYQKPGLQGRVLAVNAGWNFVVLSVGDKQGVMVNSSLIVVRGNEPIARLRITSVEPSTSIADVLPGTVRKGASVQPGDTVIFEGTRGSSGQPSSKPSSEGPAPSSSPAAPALPNS